MIRYHGPNRCKDLTTLIDSDVVITTYNTLAKEFGVAGQTRTSPLHSIEWFRVVLDEGIINVAKFLLQLTDFFEPT